MEEEEASAVRFEGRWREYAPIAFSNLLLTFVTLGIYRFWATTRTRNYLWSRTRVIDDTLEWTGTGRELLIGFIGAILLFGLPFLILQFGVQALALRGHEGLAAIATIASVIAIFFMAGVARFRALRFRLSRTYWHGIRGGSDDRGLRYGLTWMARTTIGYLAAGLLIPWAMMSLWNRRWQAMSFGGTPFEAVGRARPIMMRFLLFYLMPIFVVVLLGAGAAALAGLGGWILETGTTGQIIGRIITLLATIVAVYVVLGIIALTYYAAFLREAIGGLTLGDVQFHFTARTRHWLMLMLGDVLLVVATLGIGAIFLTYRHWRFFALHLEASGEISLGALAQSATREPRQGEGLLDALDIGAI